MKNERKTMKKWAGIIGIGFKIIFLFLSFVEIFLATAIISFAIFKNFFLDLNIEGSCLREVLLAANIEIGTVFLIAIYIFVIIAFFIAISLYLTKILKEIAKTGKPFSYDIIKRITHISVLSLILGIIFNFILIFMSVIGFITASIFDYQKANIEKIKKKNEKEKLKFQKKKDI